VLRLVAVIGCAGLALGSGPSALAATLAWVHTRAAVVNHLDDSDRLRGAFDVRLASAVGVVASNQALATSRCDDCRTVAVAIQVVVVGGGPTDVIATNDSAAINEGCTGCAALALSYQFVVLSADRLRLSAQGRRTLDAAETDLRALLDAAPADGVIIAEVAGIARRVEQVLAEELESIPVMRQDIDRRTRTQPLQARPAAQTLPPSAARRTGGPGRPAGGGR
jgi:hypothetical protein